MQYAVENVGHERHYPPVIVDSYEEGLKVLREAQEVLLALRTVYKKNPRYQELNDMIGQGGIPSAVYGEYAKFKADDPTLGWPSITIRGEQEQIKAELKKDWVISLQVFYSPGPPIRKSINEDYSQDPDIIGTNLDKFNVRLYAVRQSEGFLSLFEVQPAILVPPDYVEGLEDWVDYFMEDCGYIPAKEIIRFMKAVNR